MPTSQPSHSVLRSAPLRNEPPPRPLARAFDAAWTGWKKMSMGLRITIASGLVMIVVIAVSTAAWRASTRPVPLYASTTAEDVAQISSHLYAMGARFTVEGNSILVDRADRPRIVGALLTFGFPRHTAPTGQAPMFMGESQRREQALTALRVDLTNQIQQFECVGYANVNLTAGEVDAVPPVKPRASILINLRPNARPSKSQVQAIVNLVAGSVTGLDPADVKIVDTSGRVWNDGARITLDDGVDTDDMQIAIKRAYENVYASKVKDALDKILGEGNYALTVNALVDFSQVKIEQTSVGGPGNDGVVVLKSVRSCEDYKSKPDAGKKSGVSDKQQYSKVTYSQQTEAGRVVRTVLVPPGVVERLCATLVVDRQLSAQNQQSLELLLRGAMGLNADISVRSMALNRELPVSNSAPVGPMAEAMGQDGHVPLLLFGVVPSLLLLAVAAMWLACTREARRRQTALELKTVGGTSVNDIADLLNDKRGVVDASRVTAVARNRQSLESIARERPSRVAEVLKSTWLSDGNR